MNAQNDASSGKCSKNVSRSLSRFYSIVLMNHPPGTGAS